MIYVGNLLNVQSGIQQGPPPPEYYDNYSGPANPACFLTFDAVNDWGGQSFTPIQKYNLARVDLWIKKGPGSVVGNVLVELYGVDENGHPDGQMLNSGVIPNADISEDYAWVTCYLNVMRLTAYIVNPSTKYCLVVHGLGFTEVHILYWQCGGDGSGYPNGDKEWSINGGATWSTDNTRDQLFRCYKTPWLDNYSGYAEPFGSAVLNSANIWVAQTFTAMKSYPLNRIDMYFRKDPGDYVDVISFGLYNVLPNEHPNIVGGALAVGTVLDVDVPVTSQWVRCDMSTFNLVVDTKKAIVVHGPSLNPSNVLRISCDDKYGASDYEGGYKEYSSNGGGSWTIHYTNDFLFRCYSA